MDKCLTTLTCPGESVKGDLELEVVFQVDGSLCRWSNPRF